MQQTMSTHYRHADRTATAPRRLSFLQPPFKKPAARPYEIRDRYRAMPRSHDVYDDVVDVDAGHYDRVESMRMDSFGECF